MTLTALLLPSCGGGGGGSGGGTGGGPPAPGPFDLLSPAASAVNVPASPTFTWTASVSSTSYTLQVATDSAFANIVLSQTGIVATSFTPGSPLAAPLPHFWRVTAVNPAGQTMATTAPWSFTTESPPPYPFDLLLPQDGATGVSAKPYFSWNPLDPALSYTVQVSVSITFSSLVIDQLLPASETSYTPPDPLALGQTYYWRVLANDAGTPVTAPSAPWSFTVEPAIGAFFPISGATLHDVVVDSTHNRVYVANETDSRIEIYDAAAGTLLAPLTVAGTPWGMDLVPDDSLLLACLSNTNTIAVIDVTVTPPVVSQYVSVPADTWGWSQPRNIACASNNKAFFGCVTGTPGNWCGVRELDVGTWTIAQRVDVNPIQDPTYIAASKDRSRIILGLDNLTTGDYYVYSAATDSFDDSGFLNLYNSHIRAASANADGSRFSLTPHPTGSSGTFVNTLYIVDSTLRQRAGIRWVANVTTSPPIGGFAFAGTRGYRVITGNAHLEIVDTDRWEILDRIPTPVALLADVEIDDAGTTAFAVAQGGFAVIPLAVNRAPIPDRPLAGTVVAGESMSLTLLAADPDGDTLVFSAGALPPNMTFDPITRILTFTPSLGQVGSNPYVLITTGDGSLSATHAFKFKVTNPASYPARTFPVDGEIADIVFDPVNNRLYFTNTTRNRVEVIDVTANALRDPIPVGSRPHGLDLHAGSTKLVVCPSWSEYIEVVDLAASPTATASVAVPTDFPFGARRNPHSTAVAANGKALVALWDMRQDASMRLRELDVATNAVVSRTDIGLIEEPNWLRASGDRSVLALAQDDSASPPNGPLTAYASTTNAFVASTNSQVEVTGIDVDGDGTRILVSPGPKLYHLTGTFLVLQGTFAGSSSHAAFRPGTTTAYRTTGNGVDVLNLASFTVSGLIPLPELATGVIRSNPSGTRLFVVTRSGVTIVTVP